MVVDTANASCHISLPILSKHYIFNQGLLDQYRLTKHACSFSSKCPTSFSVDTHICSWKLPNAILFLFYFFTSEQMIIYFLLEDKTEEVGQGGKMVIASVLQDSLKVTISNPIVTIIFLRS